MRVLLATCVLLSAASLMHAGVIWDYGPITGLYMGTNFNQTDGQNYADNVTFDADTLVGGFNLFTDYSLTDPTATFHFKVLADNGGVPGAYLYEWDQAYSWFGDSGYGTGYGSIYEAQFVWPTPLVFLAGTTYWVGVSGNGFDAGQSTVSAGTGDGFIAVFSNNTYEGLAPVSDQMFQLTDAPEPAPLTLVPATLMGLAFLRRKR
jgi:hypothetical protein